MFGINLSDIMAVIWQVLPFIIITIILLIVVFIAPKMTPKQIEYIPQKSDATSKDNTMPIVAGTILFIVGLVSILMRGEITVKILGRKQVMNEFFWGGNTVSYTLTSIVVIGSIAMIIGIIILVNSVMGILKTTRQNIN